ncbi:rhs element Vgr domain protein [Janthinobacterium agaricidamnosum NBRC 102515 = DSM 9628]|uniref:Rhs element Vgr domain protein n=1 Tax=Janthinobacterium agaricidamnosum NBRC 102515 = DSM 9628 TaxID=1349767 RepID=W0V5W0_9BURK|nr:rhs element Vgr domain protein [Janthinobacterium agaricidamnosum NBRC 102515 = DSM 9628]
MLLTAQGAYLKLEGGNIEIHGPGKMEFKSSMRDLTGPLNIPNIEIANKIYEINIKRDLKIEYVDADGNFLKNEPITLNFLNKQPTLLTLDKEGTATIKNAPLGPFRAEQSKRK